MINNIFCFITRSMLLIIKKYPQVRVTSIDVLLDNSRSVQFHKMKLESKVLGPLMRTCNVVYRAGASLSPIGLKIGSQI